MNKNLEKTTFFHPKKTHAKLKLGFCDGAADEFVLTIIGI
jgi:hypothetical protein